MKDDSFTVDMEPFSSVTKKDIFISEFNRNVSRKGSQIVSEAKMNLNRLLKDGDGEVIASPKGSFVVNMIPDKLALVSQSTNNAHVNCAITIVTDGTTTKTTNIVGTPTKSSCSGKRLSRFKRSSVLKPRQILFFFATMSSMGTILLICLTLYVANYNVDVNC
ncbi:uncharacterized protein [Rutidosis leptorrhynchoides]|uniref:uncharacterized protein n=1 Tax=Rutidosis leptorrhynchoides TaxID=125765 RepID=UPI003A99E067